MCDVISLVSAITSGLGVASELSANRQRKKLAARQERQALEEKAEQDLSLRAERKDRYDTATRTRAAARSPAAAAAGLFSPRSFFRV